MHNGLRDDVVDAAAVSRKVIGKHARRKHAERRHTDNHGAHNHGAQNERAMKRLCVLEAHAAHRRLR